MKIAYLAAFDGNCKSGVTKKLLAQIENLKNLNHDAKLFFLTDKEKNLNYGFVNQYLYPKSRISPLLNKIIFRLFFGKKVTELSKEFDVVYIRAEAPIPFLLRPERKKQNAKLIFEMQSIIENELQLRKAKLSLFLLKFFTPLIMDYSDGIVSVTEEISRYYLKRSKGNLKPHCTIGNGINVAQYKIRTIPKYCGDYINLLFVAQVAKWHGIDRLIRGIASYKGKTEIILNVVGEGPAISELKKLTFNLGLENKVIYNGFKSGKELDKLFDECHVAIGSLGIHRKGLSETSELKAREYCARGIPFITSSPDSDFHDKFPYVYRFSSDESSIDVNQVVSFSSKVLTDPNHSVKMNAYATKYLDWKPKMQKLAYFFQKVCDKSV